MDSERPYITQREQKMQALMVAVSGNLDEFSMANLVTQIREEIVALPEVTLRRSRAVKTLRSRWRSRSNGYVNTGLPEPVASVISRWSIDLPGFDSHGWRKHPPSRERTGLYRRGIRQHRLANQSGRFKLRLRDVASINDGFVEWPGYAYFNGAPAMMIE